MARTFNRTISFFGQQYVGKSALILQFINKAFNFEYNPTISKICNGQIEFNGNSYLLKIQDTAGLLNSQTHIPSSYIINTDTFVLVYSIADRGSFEAINQFYENLCIQNNQKIPVLLVGNKADLTEYRQVDKQEGEQLAEKWNSLFIETSALTGESVEEIFVKCLKLFDEEKKDDVTNSSFKKNNCFVS
jgi:small GTP-binding protein